MYNNIQATLKYCIGCSRRGEKIINVFDLMYETGLTYPELHSVLAHLAERKLIIQPSETTVEYIGGENLSAGKLPDIEAPVDDIGITAENSGSVLNGHYENSEEGRRFDRMSEDAPSDDDNGFVEIDRDYIKVLKFCIEQGEADVFSIQRNFPIGYMKAIRIIEWMRDMDYITEKESGNPGKILVDMERFERLYGKQPDEYDDGFDNFDLDVLFKADGEVENYADDETEQDADESVASMFTERLNGTFRWGRNPRGIVIFSDGFRYSTGDDVQFRLIFKDGTTYLSDDGFTRNSLAARNNSGHTRAKNKIIKNIQGKRIEYFLGELRIEVGIYTFFTDYMYFYSVIENLIGN